ncbi:MAG: insulinase family protein, partial [Eubacterium sp.]
NMGGLLLEPQMHRLSHETDGYKFTVEVKFKAMFDKMRESFKLVKAMLFTTDFNDDKRLQEIIAELKSRLQSIMEHSGDSAAALRAASYYSKTMYIKEQYYGISFYKFIESIDANFESKKEELKKKLGEACRCIFTRKNLVVNYTAPLEQLAELNQEIENLPFYESCTSCKGTHEFEPEQRNEGFKTSARIQYVARSGNYTKAGYEFNGSLNVLRTIMNYEYLWNNVRVRGGAYGCSALFTRQGDCTFTSYRDPNLKITNQVFEKAADYIEKFSAGNREMNKFIIGTMSELDAPLSTSAKGARNFIMYMTDTTYEDIQKSREEVLTTTASDIQNLAPMIRAAMECNNICTVGNEGKIEEDREIFNETKNLFD